MKAYQIENTEEIYVKMTGAGDITSSYLIKDGSVVIVSEIPISANEIPIGEPLYGWVNNAIVGYCPSATLSEIVAIFDSIESAIS